MINFRRKRTRKGEEKRTKGFPLLEEVEKISDFFFHVDIFKRVNCWFDGFKNDIVDLIQSIIFVGKHRYQGPTHRSFLGYCKVDRI